MIHGVDTGFPVAAEMAEHAEHAAARQTLSRLHAASDEVAIVRHFSLGSSNTPWAGSGSWTRFWRRLIGKSASNYCSLPILVTFVGCPR